MKYETVYKHKYWKCCEAAKSDHKPITDITLLLLLFN